MKDRRENFRKELESLINRYSMEELSNTPDFILAEYLEKCMDTFNSCINWRDNLKED